MQTTSFVALLIFRITLFVSVYPAGKRLAGCHDSDGRRLIVDLTVVRRYFYIMPTVLINSHSYVTL